MSYRATEGICLTFHSAQGEQHLLPIFELGQMLLCLQKLLHKANFLLEQDDLGFQAISSEQRQESGLYYDVSEPIGNELFLSVKGRDGSVINALKLLWQSARVYEGEEGIDSIPESFDSKHRWVKSLARLHSEFEQFYKWASRLCVGCYVELNFSFEGRRNSVVITPEGQQRAIKLRAFKALGQQLRIVGRLKGEVSSSAVVVMVPAIGAIECRLSADLLAKHKHRLMPGAQIEVQGQEIVHFGAKTSAPPMLEVIDIRY